MENHFKKREDSGSNHAYQCIKHQYSAELNNFVCLCMCILHNKLKEKNNHSFETREPYSERNH